VADDISPLRIGHAERDQVIALLQEHTTAGRLELDEFEDRIGLVTQARTTADLDAVLADLPRLGAKAPYQPYVAPVAPGPVTATLNGPPLQPLRAWRGTHLPGWVAISLMMLGIWAMTGFGYFWPIWVIVPMAIGGLKTCGVRRRAYHGHRHHHHGISA